MHTSRFLVVLGLAVAGCGYSLPTDDTEYHAACYSNESCPNGWNCGSVWVDGDLCNTADRGSMRDGKILVSDGSVVWGYDANETSISFTCIEEVTPVAAVGTYCYESAPTCGGIQCSPGEKCGYEPGSGPLALRCLDPDGFAPGIDQCPCPADHPFCRIVIEPSMSGNSYQACTNQP